MSAARAKLRRDAVEQFRRSARAALGLILGVGAPFAATAQVAAPRDTVATTIIGREENAQVAISYGRQPRLGRPELGGIIPESVAWPIGAGDVATLTNIRPLLIGTLRVPPGTYALWLKTTAGRFMLIVSRRVGPDANAYDKAADLGAVDMKVDTLAAAVEQLTIAIASQRFGPDTTGIEFDAKKSRGPIQHYTLIERPGSVRSVIITWGRIRLSTRVDAVGDLAHR